MKRTAFFTLIFFLLLASPFIYHSPATATPLETTLRPSSGTIEDTFLLTITIHNAQETGQPAIGNSDDFTAQYIGPQSAVQIVNGVVSRQTSFLFELSPKREGTLTTPKVVIEVGGSTLSSQQRNVTVGPEAESARSSDEIGLTQKIAPKGGYVGQQLRYALELLTALPITEVTPPDLTIDNFRVEAMPEEPPSIAMRNGTPTQSLIIRRALFPLTSGTLVIPERALRFKTIDQSMIGGLPFGLSGIFDDPFARMGRRRPEAVRASSLSVEISPLPTPPDYLPHWEPAAPLVGATNISVSYDDTSIKVGESKTITVSIMTEGAAPEMKRGLLESGTHYRVYQELVEARTSIQNDALVSHRTFSVTIVPTAGGVVEIPPLALGFFDPESKSYRTAQSRSISFSVIGPTPVPTATGNLELPHSGINDKSLATPPSIPLTDGGNRTALSNPAPSKQPSLPQLLFAIASLFGIGSLVALFVLRRRRNRALSFDLHLMPIRNAETLDHLQQAVASSLVQALATSTQSISGENLKALVRHRVSDGALQFELLDILDSLDNSRFSRHPDESHNWSLLRDRVVIAIGELLKREALQKRVGVLRGLMKLVVRR